MFTGIQGTFEVLRMHGARYAPPIIDDYSRYAVVFFLVHEKRLLSASKSIWLDVGYQGSCERTMVEGTSQWLSRTTVDQWVDIKS